MRLEFSRATRRDALARAGKPPLCEAVGPEFGLEPDQRCNAPLAYGVEFHHVLEAEFGGDNSLGNCLAVCKKCHKFVTRTGVQRIRKSDRQRDKDTGAMKPTSRPMPGSRASGWKKPMNGKAERRT